MRRSDLLRIRARIEQAAVFLPDGDALDAVELFPAYQTGVWYEADHRFRYGDRLYRVLIAHTTQEDWMPDGTPTLYAEVEKPGQGDTPDNPIPYNNNMELFAGKYYAQGGVVYRCIRGTGFPVYHNLADLVGLYVEAVM